MNSQDELENTAPGVSSRFICTANHGFAPYAQEELRRKFGSVKSTVLVPGEVFIGTLELSSQEAVERLRMEPPIFLRHIFPVQYQIGIIDGDKDNAMLQLTACLKHLPELRGAQVTVQARKAGQDSWEGTSTDLKDSIQNGLKELVHQFVVKDAELVVSVLATDKALYAGISSPEDNLSDWNGGAVRFQKEESQISRAKFKLLEAERVFGIEFSSFEEALDIGAAPGGWTSFLLERGLRVTAVDPAKMHPSLLDSERLTYLNRNADSVKFREDQFDVLVCDMSWSPKLTAKLVTGLLYSLVPGGTAIVTVKLLSKKPLALIREVMDTFENANMQIQRAKQLFHNRDEITLYMIKY
ncbi:SAM-dependent methyltransferase [Paenibacillus sp. SN-8-1]|uniref:SAM-dependent methyltransferase n=1 Tax=Paenibacillus sp. SN-8-1 TaxID=3435409 RepID=UPI003D9A90A1